MYVTIFIDMLARCVNPDVFPQGALVSPLGVELTIKLPCRLQIALVCVHAPRGLFRLSFFAPPSSPPPLSLENLYLLHFFAYAEIIFAHILVSPARAIITHL